MKSSLTMISKALALALVTSSSVATANVTFTKTYDHDEYGAVKYLHFDGKYIKYGYDLIGEHKRVRYNSHSLFEVSEYDSITGAPTTYKLGALAHSSITGEPVSYADAQYQLDIGFDQLGLIQVSSLSAGSSAQLPLFTEYGYQSDARGFITKMNKDVSTDGALAKRQQFEYSYTTQGQLANYQWYGSDNYSSINDTPSYDQSLSLAYEYDDRGNLQSKVGGGKIGEPQQWQNYNQANQVQNPDFIYDEKGRLKQDQHSIYRYNQLDRLALVIDNSTGLWTAHYLYDAQGNRVRKVTQTTSIYYDRDDVGNLLQEKHFDTKTKALVKVIDYVNANGLNVAAVHYVAVNGDPNQLVQEKIDYQYSGGLQGSNLVNWTSTPIDAEQASGEIKHNEYSPFGQLLTSTDAEAYGFTGHEYDKETDGHYMKARYYDHDYGRFRTPDPARDTDIYNPKSFNLYSYVANNPVNKIDPTGLAATYNLNGHADSSAIGNGGMRSTKNLVMPNIKSDDRGRDKPVYVLTDSNGAKRYWVKGKWTTEKPNEKAKNCFSKSCVKFVNIDRKLRGVKFSTQYKESSGDLESINPTNSVQQPYHVIEKATQIQGYDSKFAGDIKMLVSAMWVLQSHEVNVLISPKGVMLVRDPKNIPLIPASKGMTEEKRLEKSKSNINDEQKKASRTRPVRFSLIDPMLD